MTRITAKKQQIFCSEAAADQIAAFATAKTGTPVYSTDPDVLQTAEYTEGWKEATLNDYAPYREEMNGVQYGITRQLAYLQQDGVQEWLPTVEFFKGGWTKVIDSNGTATLYESLSDNNINNDPSTDTVNWKMLEFIPNQSGQSGKYLTTDGTNASWSSINLSGFANKDLSNLSVTGVNNLVQYAHELDFTNISSISTTSTNGAWALYTSVDDGILVVEAGGTNDIIAEISDNVVNYSLSAVRSYWTTSHNASVFFPMVKGMTLRYRNRGTSVSVIFIPFKKSI